MLTARRKGQAPVEIATAESGVTVWPDEAAVSLGVPSPLQVYFAHGGNNREMLVLELTGAGQRWPIAAFCEQFQGIEGPLGQWLRVAVESALDRALAP